MKTPQSVLPDLPTLTKRLTAGLHDPAGNASAVKVLKRTRPHFMNTFPNEIVTCQWPGGRKRRMFIKYGANRNHSAWGHRGDLAYEAEVYQRVLRPLLEFRPRYLGAHTYPATGDTALFLEYADRCLPRNLHFRWLGERPEKAVSEKNLWRYRQLRLAAKMLGLI